MWKVWQLSTEQKCVAKQTTNSKKSWFWAKLEMPNSPHWKKVKQDITANVTHTYRSSQGAS